MPVSGFDQLVLSPLDAVRMISMLVTLSAAVLWLRRKTVLDYYLAGRWSGNLSDVSNPRFVIQCSLYLFRDHNRCTGLLYYEVHSDKELISRGVDRLLEYEDRDFFPRQWRPRFQRVLHTVTADGEFDPDPYVYDYTFQIKQRWFKSRMDAQVTIQHRNRTLKGLWHQP